MKYINMSIKITLKIKGQLKIFGFEGLIPKSFKHQYLAY